MLDLAKQRLSHAGDYTPLDYPMNHAQRSMKAGGDPLLKDRACRCEEWECLSDGHGVQRRCRRGERRHAAIRLCSEWRKNVHDGKTLPSRQGEYIPFRRNLLQAVASSSGIRVGQHLDPAVAQVHQPADWNTAAGIRRNLTGTVIGQAGVRDFNDSLS